MDVTSIVNAWLDGSIPNYGFVIKHSTTAETDDNIYGSLKFFGRETHTIYIPRLESFWADTTYTGSFTSKITATYPYVVYAKNIKSKYTRGEITKIRIGVRDQFPTRSYTSIAQTATERK
jgi:hypothetical protein